MRFDDFTTAQEAATAFRYPDHRLRPSVERLTYVSLVAFLHLRLYAFTTFAVEGNRRSPPSLAWPCCPRIAGRHGRKRSHFLKHDFAILRSIARQPPNGPLWRPRALDVGGIRHVCMAGVAFPQIRFCDSTLNSPMSGEGIEPRRAASNILVDSPRGLAY